MSDSRQRYAGIGNTPAKAMEACELHAALDGYHWQRAFLPTIHEYRHFGWMEEAPTTFRYSAEYEREASNA